MQNGAPDGVALDNGGTLIQFLSYEGSFMAASGVANGVTSTDIGVSEPGAVGESLQLIGSGTTYENFSWTGPTAASSGLINSGQSFGAAVPSITLGADVTGLDYFEGQGPSSEGSFSVTGTNLTADVNISVPGASNFEISLTSGGTFGTSVVVTQTGGSASATVYVRLKASLAVGPYSDIATATSTGASDATVNLNGNVNPADPQITITSFLDSFNYSAGMGPSGEDSFTVEGLFLTSDIVVTSPSAAFELSLTSGGTFSGSVSVPFGSGTVASNLRLC